VQHRQRRAGRGRPADQPSAGDFAVPQLPHTALLKHNLGKAKTILLSDK
jgi:hypothetical protein